MCAWRVLATLRRVACVEACRNLAPHHTTRFCCAAALGARVHRCGNMGTFLCSSNNLDTNPSLYIYVHRGSSSTSIFSVVFAKIADGREQTTCGEQNATGRTMCVRVLYPLFTTASCFFCHSICHVLLSSCSLVLNTRRIPRHTCPFSLPGGP